MTQAEFNEAQRKSHDACRRLLQSMRREIADLYRKAADEIADRIKTLEINKRGTSLTAASLRSLEKSLRETGARIAATTEEKIIDAIDNSIFITSGAHTKYLRDAISRADIEKIKISTINEMYTQINETLVNLTYTRIWSDGYTFSDKIWGYPGTPGQPYLPGLGGYWEQNVKDLIITGLMQGRDILQIAKDLTVYANKGKGGLMKRYGDLVRGTSEFSKRIPKWIDWRAMRLARSELYISLQDAAKIQGRLNPAILAYIWNLTGGVSHENCICPDLAANSPYNEGEVPGFPHPNCLCFITQKIRSRDEFVNDLIDWENGISIPYMDAWFTDVYLPGLFE